MGTQLRTSLLQTLNTALPTLALLTRVRIGGKQLSVFVHLVIVQTLGTDGTASVCGGRVGTLHGAGLLQTPHISIQTLALAALVLWVRKGHSIVIGVALVGTAVTPPTSTGVGVGGGAGDPRTIHLHTVH